MCTKLKLMGVDVGSIGDAMGATPGAHSYYYIDDARDIYKKIVVSADGTRSCWARSWWVNVEAYGGLLQLMLNSMDLPEYPDVLILPVRDGAGRILSCGDAIVR